MMIRKLLIFLFCIVGISLPNVAQESLTSLIKRANAGQTDAQVELGWRYENRVGVNLNLDEAYKWYNKAANGGNSSGQMNLGRMYFYGYSVEKDYKMALKWFQKSANAGNDVGQNWMGYVYLRGYGVTKDYDEALRWFNKSANQNNATAQFFIGQMYYMGYGVTKDFAEAFKWFQKSAMRGNTDSQDYLGAMYYMGLGVDKNYVEAEKWSRKAAEAGKTNSQYNLGNMYFEGQGVTKSYVEAAKWYRKAADGGNAKAQNSLGYMYRNGYGVNMDNNEALKWYKLSADNGNAAAMYNLGVVYENGFGVEKNKNMAINYYRKAAQKGDTEAKKALSRMGVTTNNTSSSQAKISGFVQDSWNSWPIANATIYDETAGVKTETDNIGHFVLLVEPGFHTIRISKAGYDDYLITKNIIKQDMPTLNINLDKKNVQSSNAITSKPKVNWGELPSKVSSASLTVDIVVISESKLTTCTLTLNGNTERGMALMPTSNSNNRTIQRTLTLSEGVNTLKITATNAEGTTVDTRYVTYNRPQQAQTTTYFESSSQRRIALVIGNANYTGDMRLANPVNDAKAVANELEKLGFHVICAYDRNKEQMEKAVSDFGKEMKGYDVALFFYAGHGLGVEGHNYMVPIDAVCNDEKSVKYRCVDLNYVLDAMEKCPMKIVMLDACRNNPFARAWKSRGDENYGLNHVNSPTGTLISFATAPGNTAADGRGSHSPYTTAFLKVLKEKGVVLETFFKLVRTNVKDATGGKQIPWESNSTEGEFYFRQ